MKVVMISGCYDIIHGGHVEFFRQAKLLGDKLIVSVANDEVLFKHKHRNPSIPVEHKVKILQSLKMIDEVVVSDGEELGLDFKDHFLRIVPNILAVTEDDKYAEVKKKLCASTNTQYVVLKKSLDFKPITTSEIIQNLKAPTQVPLRIDFAGGWLDVPKLAIEGGLIVNCAITPMVSLSDWKFNLGGGLGGSAAYSILKGEDAVRSEIMKGAGWQDPAIIRETGLCVWKSGELPVLDAKINPTFLQGKMGLLWLGVGHCTIDKINITRDYGLINEASIQAANGVFKKDYEQLAESIKKSYIAQLQEGMEPLPYVKNSIAFKYCGSGYGGYAVYLFSSEDARNNTEVIKVEPYMAG